LRRSQHCIILCHTLLGLALCVPHVRAQGVEVTAEVFVHDKAPAATGKHKSNLNSADVVVWLTPLQPDVAHSIDSAHPGPFRLVQKDKQFSPHLLVVPTGSSVEFPNEDPFFHNVFSLFNGKRFDLGLYESGTSRSVRFDREGVSYIFCNIHPEMGAVVLSLSTPYYGISTAGGSVAIRNVPPGTYHLHVWSETAQSANPVETQRIVQVTTAPVHLGEIALQGTANPMEHHKNKFDEEYPAHPVAPY